MGDSGSQQLSQQEDEDAADAGDVDVEVLGSIYPEHRPLLQDQALSPRFKGMLLALRTAKDSAEEASESDSDEDASLGDIYGPPPPTQPEKMTFESVLAQEEEEEAFVEDPPERVDGALDPLPTENDKKYPQENKAYFSKKNYCRNDKYDLSDFVCKDVSLPSFTKIFELKPKVVVPSKAADASASKGASVKLERL